MSLAAVDYTFQPYTIKDVNGVQVGILGLTPPAVVHWERPENIVGCVFGDAMAAANTYVPEMQAAGADVIVVAAHSGLDETYGYGRDENFVKFLANEVPGIDVILAGHAHAIGSEPGHQRCVGHRAKLPYPQHLRHPHHGQRLRRRTGQ